MKILLIILSLSSFTATADDWGVGAIALPQPAMSVKYGSRSDEAYHATGYYGRKRMTISGDYQRLYTPAFGYGLNTRLRFYSGFGLVGESLAEEDAEEVFHLRFPIGTQFDLKTIRMQTFIEAAGLIGPLPTTDLASGYLGGLRATF